MKRWRISALDTAIPMSYARHIVAGIGTADLARHFLEAMRSLLALTYCTVFALEADGRVSTISTASVHGEMAAMTAIEYMRLGFDQKDSNMVWLAGRKTPAQSQAWLSHQHAEEVADADYRRICYGEPGIRERASVLLLLNDGRRIAVSFYRGLELAVFTAADFELIERCAPLLMEAVKTHIRQVQRDTPAAALHQKILSLLPNRERQVISHVLAGRTARQTAELLGLAYNTVLTYRYRAFVRLGIHTQRDLLAILDRTPASVRGSRAAAR